jgi:GT2 family glycosyltransferase
MKNVSWYLFCANDVQFAPSQLAVLNRRFWMKSGLLYSTSNRDTSNNIDISYFNWKNMNPGGYNLFIMTRRVFDVVGMFDENMYPAFFEDADMDRRVELCKRMPNQR